MNLLKTKNNARIVAPLIAPVALTVALLGCAPATNLTTATPAADSPTFTQAATTPKPTVPRSPQPTTAIEDTEHYGPGLYRLDLGLGIGPRIGPRTGPSTGEKQFLTCLVQESPGEVVSCGATVPVRWKELDGQHRQARTVVINQNEDGALEVRAEVAGMATPRIRPIDITGSAVISGLHVTVTDNEARFSTDPDELVGSVLITPDSYELISERRVENIAEITAETSLESVPGPTHRAATVKNT